MERLRKRHPLHPLHLLRRRHLLRPQRLLHQLARRRTDVM
jgi:hypothetical protein